MTTDVLVGILIVFLAVLGSVLALLTTPNREIAGRPQALYGETDSREQRDVEDTRDWRDYLTQMEMAERFWL